MLYRKQCAEIGFAGQWRQFWPEWQEAWKSAQECWGLSIAALLDEDDTQSQKMLAEQLGVSQAAISMRLHAMGRFKRSENGCRLNWTIGRWSDAKTHAKFCLSDKKESRSCVGLWQAMKSESIFRILNARNLGLIPPNHQHLPQDQIALARKRCCAFGGIRRVSSTTSW